MNADPQSVLEGTRSSFVAEAADATPDTRADTQDAARWFFIAAALIALTDIAIAACFGHQMPNGLVVAALAVAMAGIATDLAIGTDRGTSGRWHFIKSTLASDGGSAFAVGVLFLAFYGATISPPTPYIEPVQQAYAFLHGRAWVDAPSYMEHVVWHGRSYLLHPPLAALITLPAVAIWGWRRIKPRSRLSSGGLARPGVAAAGQDRPWTRGANMADAVLRHRHNVLV